ncbi:MAG: peptidoglycan-associated lipoprotein Pal [Rhodobacteraceae bacterium]|nr:peptidoglycan-associated lipoprotein Pal [Paracoccaceae bacterium]MCY4249965.1 peptidoglycan-associated lipoprotein Pal [Paracoccaceae bacterium]MCY4308270.1 peptidoglycan-associated lipoprotein Pal [Paracoccaceae bacterium]
MKLLRILGLIGCLLFVAGCGANTVTRGSAVNTGGGNDTGDGFTGIEDGVIDTESEFAYFSKDYFDYEIGDRVFFALNESALSNEAREILMEQSDWLQRNPDTTITIEGHADERGTREYNLALGARRSEAVRTFLLQQGIGAVRMSTVSYGKERPFAACSDETCWSKNRRVVTQIEETTGS